MLSGQINLIFQKPTPVVRPSAISLKYYMVRFVALEILHFITDQITSKSLLSPPPLLSSLPHSHCCYCCSQFLSPLFSQGNHSHLSLHQQHCLKRKKKKTFNTKAQYVNIFQMIHVVIQYVKPHLCVGLLTCAIRCTAFHV